MSGVDPAPTSRTARPVRLRSVVPFDTLVRRHGPTVLRVARSLVGPVDADDVWSETFLAALRAYDDLPADANHEAWLVTITHRKAIDAHRRAARRAIPHDRAGEIADHAAARTGTGVAPDADPDHRLWRALQGLTDRQRHCVTYHHVAGLSYREIAEVVGGTEAAARRAAADGMARLRSALTRQETTP